MAEGWFEEKEDKTEKKEAKEPIKDVDLLIKKYDNVMTRVQVLTDEAFEAISPLVQNLIGQGTGREEDLGAVGRLRTMLRDTRYIRTTTGKETWELLNHIQDLNAWQTRYSDQLESFIDGLSFLCSSAILIIKDLEKDAEKMDVRLEQAHEEIKRQQEEIMKQQDEMITKPKIPYEREPEPPLSDKRREELTHIYHTLPNVFAFANLVNPVREGRNLTSKEINYLKTLNFKEHRFKGTRQKEPVKAHKKPESEKPHANSEMFEPLTQEKSEEKTVNKEADEQKK